MAGQHVTFHMLTKQVPVAHNDRIYHPHSHLNHQKIKQLQLDFIHRY